MKNSTGRRARLTRCVMVCLLAVGALLTGANFAVAGPGAALTAAVAPAPIPTTSTVTVSKWTRPYGTISTATVTVLDIHRVGAAGIAIFKIDNREFARVGLGPDSRATATLPKNAPVGRRVITATFVPSASARVLKAGSVGAKSVDITKIVPTWSVSVPTVTYGHGGTVTVRLSGTAPFDGRMAVYRGSKMLIRQWVNAAGLVTLRFPITWPIGTTNLLLAHEGSSLVSATSRPVRLTTVKATPMVGLAVPGPVAYGSHATAHVSVKAGPATPTGSVTVFVDGRAVSSGSLSGGQALIATPALNSGRRVVSVRYNGDAHYAATSSGLAGVTVTAAPASNPCPAAARACIDLTHSVSWLQSGGRITYGPVPISSGRPGYRTTAGTFHVYWRDIDHHSSEFNNAPMPYSQFFNGGMAFHLGDPDVASHGCIHLSASAAVYYWNNLGVGDEVYVFGYAPY